MTDRLVTPGSAISPDTHVGSRPGQEPPAPAAHPSPARPEALVAGNRVSTGRELETD